MQKVSCILLCYKTQDALQYLFIDLAFLIGSRSGAIIAGTWATMLHMGEEGYTQTTKKIICTARYIRDG